MVLAQQAYIFVVGATFFAAFNQFLVDALGGADLLVAQFESFQGLCCTSGSRLVSKR